MNPDDIPFGSDDLDQIFGDSDWISDDELFQRMQDTALLMDEYGWRDVEQFTVNLEDIPEDRVRQISFDTFDDALKYLIDGGILGIARVGWDDEEDLARIYIDYEDV